MLVQCPRQQFWALAQDDTGSNVNFKIFKPKTDSNNAILQSVELPLVPVEVNQNS